MQDWMPFFSVQMFSYAPWYMKYVVGPCLMIAQLMVLIFLLALAIRFAWTI